MEFGRPAYILILECIIFSISGLDHALGQTSEVQRTIPSFKDSFTGLTWCFTWFHRYHPFNKCM